VYSYNLYLRKIKKFITHYLAAAMKPSDIIISHPLTLRLEKSEIWSYAAKRKFYNA